MYYIKFLEDIQGFKKDDICIFDYLENLDSNNCYFKYTSTIHNKVFVISISIKDLSTFEILKPQVYRKLQISKL